MKLIVEIKDEVVNQRVDIVDEFKNTLRNNLECNYEDIIVSSYSAIETDLELSKAIRLAFKCENADKDTILFINSEWIGAEVDNAEAELNCEAGLLEWYRKKKLDEVQRKMLQHV